jgi:hypothetical protein
MFIEYEHKEKCWYFDGDSCEVWAFAKAFARKLGIKKYRKSIVYSKLPHFNDTKIAKLGYVKNCGTYYKPVKYFTEKGDSCEFDLGNITMFLKCLNYWEILI